MDSLVLEVNEELAKWMKDNKESIEDLINIVSEEHEDKEYIEEEPKSEELIKLLTLIDQGKNVFVTGSGGTGKSYLIKEAYKHILERGKKVYMTASTGVAAEGIGGSTLHSWAGVKLGDKSAYHYSVTIPSNNPPALKRWEKTNVLIIDEISMVGCKFFDMLGNLGKLIRGNVLPFGGIQIIICGDMCQLPPVKDGYIFKAETFRLLDFVTLRLENPWRFQKDIEFFEILSRIRLGNPTDKDCAKLEERKLAYYKEVHNKKFGLNEIKPTILFSKKIDVTDMNLKELALIDEDEFKYVATDHLELKHKSASRSASAYQEIIEKNVPTELFLKKGAQVMLIWNLDVKMGLCNGSRGVVIECHDSCVIVKFKCGEIAVNSNVWSIEDDNCLFTRCQIPLILAYSITIHKSQSATLDSVIVDIGTSIFSPNMAYVALSRCRSLDGIYLNNFIREKIYCDKDALVFETEGLEAVLNIMALEAETNELAITDGKDDKTGKEKSENYRKLKISYQ